MKQWVLDTGKYIHRNASASTHSEAGKEADILGYTRQYQR